MNSLSAETKAFWGERCDDRNDGMRIQSPWQRPDRGLKVEDPRLRLNYA